MDCGDCKFFRQHYVISSGRYMALDYGHCVARCRKKMYAETLPPESEFYITVQVYPKATE